LIVVLDSGVVGLLCSPKGGGENGDCRLWATELLQAGHHIVLPEIVDYETRRVYEHRGMTRYVRRLDDLVDALIYQPLSTPIMRRAAQLWGEARRAGQKTARDEALDIDMVLCAQVQLLLEGRQDELVVATTNVRHLAPFVPATAWREIRV
jgi:hypothetical protein